MSKSFSDTQNFNAAQMKAVSEPERAAQAKVRGILSDVHQALVEKGYNPLTQIVGYLVSGDPTYITSHKNARTLIGRLERDELMEEIVREFLENL